MDWTTPQAIEWALDCAAGDSGPNRDTSSEAVAAGAAEWDHDGGDGLGCVAVWTTEFALYAARQEMP